MFCSEAGFAQASTTTEQHAEDLCRTCLTFKTMVDVTPGHKQLPQDLYWHQRVCFHSAS